MVCIDGGDVLRSTNLVCVSEEEETMGRGRLRRRWKVRVMETSGYHGMNIREGRIHAWDRMYWISVLHRRREEHPSSMLNYVRNNLWCMAMDGRL